MGTTLKTIYSDHRLTRVDIVELEVGGTRYFSFREETWHESKHPLGHVDSHWGPSLDGVVGGYYDSAEAAEAGCREIVPWLRAARSK